MDEFKSEREKSIDSFINKVISKKEWDRKLKKRIDKFKKVYSKELEDYDYVYNTNELYQLKLGGYIRYFNLNKEFRWGGILLRVYKDKKRNRDLMVLGNKNFKRNVVSFNSNYVFYKNHKTQSDNYKKLFLSFLNNHE